MLTKKRLTEGANDYDLFNEEIYIIDKNIPLTNLINNASNGVDDM